MKKRFVFTIVSSLMNASILFALCVSSNDMWIGCLFLAVLIFILAKLTGLATSLSAYLFWSTLSIPCSVLVFVVLPQTIQGGGGQINYTNVFMLSPTICIATWMEVIFNKVVHKKPLLMLWPFGNGEE